MLGIWNNENEGLVYFVSQRYIVTLHTVDPGRNTDTDYTIEILSHKFNVLGMPRKLDDVELVTPEVLHSTEPVDQAEIQ